MVDPCSEPDRGVLFVEAARRWLGTPYRHQSSCRGIGADCLGLVRGVWRDVFGTEPERPPAYTPDWCETSREERLLAAAGAHLVSVDLSAVTPGDVLVFRMMDRGPAKHLAILSSGNATDGRIIHAYSGHAVCETHLGQAWSRRIVAAYRFPRA